jgi:hypothetical protein
MSNNVTFGDMVKTVLGWSDETSEEMRNQFKFSRKEELIVYHSSLGRAIRNEFGLWENPWTPELVDGIDESPLHPDAISMRVIEAVWIKMQHEDHDAK